MRTWLLIILCFGATTEVWSQIVSPPRGSLVVVGGGVLDTSIVDRFLELAGGPDQPIVIIPTASAADSFGVDFYAMRNFKARNASSLTLLHTRDRAVADSDSFTQVLDKASGVWFSGGRQWRLADAYLGTATEKSLWALLDRGGVIGGSSAGATIQGSYLARGDTRTNTIMMGDHTEGFGFLKDTAIDQHLLRRNRQFDLIEIISTFPNLLGIGLDENTAIVVESDWFEVIGQSYVAIFDAARMIGSEGKFYLLAPGDRFNLPSRTAYRGEEPLDRVEERDWSSQ